MDRGRSGRRMVHYKKKVSNGMADDKKKYIIIAAAVVCCVVCVVLCIVAWFQGWMCSLGLGNSCSSTSSTSSTPSTSTPSTSGGPSTSTPSTSTSTAASGFPVGKIFFCNANDPDGKSTTDCGARGCNAKGYLGNNRLQNYNSMAAANSYDPAFLSSGSSPLTIIDCAGLTTAGTADIKSGTQIFCDTTSSAAGYTSTGPIVPPATTKFTDSTDTSGGIWAYKGSGSLDYIPTNAIKTQYYSSSVGVPLDCTGYTYGGTATSTSL